MYIYIFILKKKFLPNPPHFLFVFISETELLGHKILDIISAFLGKETPLPPSPPRSRISKPRACLYQNCPSFETVFTIVNDEKLAGIRESHTQQNCTDRQKEDVWLQSRTLYCVYFNCKICIV